MTYGSILYAGWTDNRTPAEKHAEKGYCPSCQNMNYAYGVFTGAICPLCKDTRLVKPIETKCPKCNAPAYNPCQDDCTQSNIRVLEE